MAGVRQEEVGVMWCCLGLVVGNGRQVVGKQGGVGVEQDGSGGVWLLPSCRGGGGGCSSCPHCPGRIA